MKEGEREGEREGEKEGVRERRKGERGRREFLHVVGLCTLCRH